MKKIGTLDQQREKKGLPPLAEAVKQLRQPAAIQIFQAGALDSSSVVHDDREAVEVEWSAATIVLEDIDFLGTEYRLHRAGRVTTTRAHSALRTRLGRAPAAAVEIVLAEAEALRRIVVEWGMRKHLESIRMADKEVAISWTGNDCVGIAVARGESLEWLAIHNGNVLYIARHMRAEGHRPDHDRTLTLAECKLLVPHLVGLVGPVSAVASLTDRDQ